MGGFTFSRTPVTVPRVETKFRRIVTPIPNPESLQVFQDLDRYESRSMHGQLPVVWDRADDFQVSDSSGNTWIDFTSTIFVTNAGHANPWICSALRDMIDRRLLHSYTFPTQIRARYLKKLVEFAPDPLGKAFLLSSGTEATECCLKLLRMFGQSQGKRKGGIISFEDAMHGRTLGAQMLGGTRDLRGWIGYEDPNIHRLPFPYPWTLGKYGEEIPGEEKFEQDIGALAEQGVDPDRDICGCLLESYIGWGAIFFPPGYVRALRRWADGHGIPVAFDDVQGGFGRTGLPFAYQHYGVEADLVCCGKGISSSLPLSAVLGRGHIMDLPDVGSMSSTHSANPLSCSAGLANLEFIEAHHLVEEAHRRGEILFSYLHRLKETYPKRIRYVFGKGMLASLIVSDPVTGRPDPTTASRVCEKAMQKGLLLVHTGRESIKIGPPLTIADDALREGLGVLEESFGEVTR